MRVLFLEPYYGGSHQAFVDGWSTGSSHEWTVLTLPAYKWKWRMRHAAITFTEQLRQIPQAQQNWDVLMCSDMLNLAEFKGLVGTRVGNLPSVAYFHENQLTYPVRHEDERDYHYVVSNMMTALAASAVWFNSAYHRDVFLEQLPVFLKRMPDHQPLSAVSRIAEKSHVHPQGIKAMPARQSQRSGPLHVLWAARWEHDKNPDDFFRAVAQLKGQGVEFRLSVIGETFRDVPAIFEQAKRELNDHIVYWGYQGTRGEYERVLLEADCVVSTANHEFFGITAAEAIAAGAYPLLPNRLAYPELLSPLTPEERRHFYYDGTSAHLAHKLARLAEACKQGTLWPIPAERPRDCIQRFEWSRMRPQLDASLSSVH